MGASSVASETRVTKVQPPSPAALPRQQVKTPLLWSAAESTTAADVRRQRRMLVASEPASRPGVDTVPTVEFDMPSGVMVAPSDGGSQFAGRTRPRCGYKETSRRFARMTSSRGCPARFRA
jgi:hypothetical protein